MEVVMKKISLIIIFLCIVSVFSACGKTNNQTDTAIGKESEESSSLPNEETIFESETVDESTETESSVIQESESTTDMETDFLVNVESNNPQIDYKQFITDNVHETIVDTFIKDFDGDGNEECFLVTTTGYFDDSEDTDTRSDPGHLWFIDETGQLSDLYTAPCYVKTNIGELSSGQTIIITKYFESAHDTIDNIYVIENGIPTLKGQKSSSYIESGKLFSYYAGFDDHTEEYSVYEYQNGELVEVDKGSQPF